MIQFLLYWVVSGCLWLMISRPVNVKCSTKTKCLTKSRPNIQPRLQVGVTPNMGYSVCLFWWVLCMDWLSWTSWMAEVHFFFDQMLFLLLLLLCYCCCCYYCLVWSLKPFICIYSSSWPSWPNLDWRFFCYMVAL